MLQIHEPSINQWLRLHSLGGLSDVLCWLLPIINGWRTLKPLSRHTVTGWTIAICFQQKMVAIKWLFRLKKCPPSSPSSKFTRISSTSFRQTWCWCHHKRLWCNREQKWKSKLYTWRLSSHFPSFPRLKIRKEQNKFTVSFKQLHILLIIVKYLRDFHWYNSSILSIIFSFSSSCSHLSHQSPPPALRHHPPPPHHRYQLQSCPAAAPVAAILFPQVS